MTTTEDGLKARIRLTAANDTSRDLEEAIKAAGDRGAYGIAPEVMDLLERTADRDMRNACAYFFHEVTMQDYVPRIVGVAERDDVRPDRGTIMYALAQHDCSQHVPFLARVIANDGYEAAQHACDAIEALPDALPRTALAEAVRVLKSASTAQPWRLELIEIALEQLDGKVGC